MSEKLPRVTAGKIIAVLEKAGFNFIRQSGSHKIYKNLNGKRVTIPFHGGKVLHPKVLKNIMKDADIDAMRLKKLL